MGKSKRENERLAKIVLESSDFAERKRACAEIDDNQTRIYVLNNASSFDWEVFDSCISQWPEDLGMFYYEKFVKPRETPTRERPQVCSDYDEGYDDNGYPYMDEFEYLGR